MELGPFIGKIGYWRRLVYGVRWRRTAASRRALALLSPPVHSSLATLGETAKARDEQRLEELGSHVLLWGYPGAGKSHRLAKMAARVARSGVCTLFLEPDSLTPDHELDVLVPKAAQVSIAELRYILSYRRCVVVVEDVHLMDRSIEGARREIDRIVTRLDEFGSNPKRQIICSMRWTLASPPPTFPAFLPIQQDLFDRKSAYKHLLDLSGIQPEDERLSLMFDEPSMRTELLIRIASWLIRNRHLKVDDVVTWRSVAFLREYVHALCKNDEDLIDRYMNFAAEEWPHISRFAIGTVWNELHRPDLFVERRGLMEFPHIKIGEYLVARHAQSTGRLPPWRGPRMSLESVFELWASIIGTADHAHFMYDSFAQGLSVARAVSHSLRIDLNSFSQDAGTIVAMLVHALCRVPARDEPEFSNEDVDWALSSCAEMDRGDRQPNHVLKVGRRRERKKPVNVAGGQSRHAGGAARDRWPSAAGRRADRNAAPDVPDQGQALRYVVRCAQEALSGDALSLAATPATRHRDHAASTRAQYASSARCQAGRALQRSR